MKGLIKFKKYQRLNNVKYATKNILEKIENHHKLKNKIRHWAYTIMVNKKAQII